MSAKRIILPTDFSKTARNAVRYAVELFGFDEVQYVLLHCYAMPATGTEMLISLTDILRVESEEGLEKERELLLQEFPGLETSLVTRSENGYLENVLNRIRKEDPVDLVVMGTTGATGIVKILWGSSTSTVLKRVHIPILAVPARAVAKVPSKLVMALQQEMLADFNYPNLLHEFVEKYKAEVSVITVRDARVQIPEVGAKAVANGMGARAFPTQRHDVYERDPVRGILHYLEKSPADMLVMVAREYSFIKSIFHHSSTQEMAMISKVPLLVLRERP